MRTFDLAPLYRSTVGFDRLFSMLDGFETAPGYPPYNIERTGENEYRVTVAVAGFGEKDLAIEAKENTLTIRGSKQTKEEQNGEVLYQGIAASLRRVDLTAMYGGGTLDLRLARLDPAGATISARVVFGGYRVAVPGTWRVERRGFGLFGGFGDARRQEWVDPNGPRLTIEGFAVFGGLGVVSETPDLGPARPPTLDDDGETAPRNEPPDDNRGLVTDIEQAPPAPADL